MQPKYNGFNPNTVERNCSKTWLRVKVDNQHVTDPPPWIWVAVAHNSTLHEHSRPFCSPLPRPHSHSRMDRNLESKSTRLTLRLISPSIDTSPG